MREIKMIYRSNLTCPDLSMYFKLKTPALQYNGHDVPSDPDFEPGCGFWTHDEAVILYHVARQVGGTWLDLGARLGWTAAHIIEAGARVLLVEPETKFEKFTRRLEGNLNQHWDGVVEVLHKTAGEFITSREESDVFDGFVIDADHDRPQPTLDAFGCHRIAKPDAVILMHDFWGRPIQDAVVVLMALGWRCRIYNTPNGVALLWRGFGNCGARGEQLGWFTAPKHDADPAIDWAEIRERVTDFPWDKTE